jgi:hypothetical protein
MSESKEFTINNMFTDEVLHEGLAKDFKSFCEEKKFNLEDANLEDANLRNANLEDANLRNANLVNANLVSANLVSANLEDANLRNANLVNANLVSANLVSANLVNANLEDANLPIYCKWSISFTPKTSVNLDSEKVLINEIDINTVLIKIGCKNPKTISEWDLWFSSNEAFETPRDSFEFLQIKAMYLSYKTYLQTITSFKKGCEKVV